MHRLFIEYAVCRSVPKVLVMQGWNDHKHCGPTHKGFTSNIPITGVSPYFRTPTLPAPPTRLPRSVEDFAQGCVLEPELALLLGCGPEVGGRHAWSSVVDENPIVSEFGFHSTPRVCSFWFFEMKNGSGVHEPTPV